ncbi:4-alpha-glucanotransferase [Caulobacter endophyticus]|uniref:4-alpha-glucanotransferase n=1 Tax=Caulobacter endophyticus TaxID=2172652 RepID=A0A2T9JGW2_9CAUL|nr:4-alpha-glucanotransferase [Caulobacter endophyticus]PVM82941.1 4-alpha-glucanotransferase [Caulobacter endophyticus]
MSDSELLALADAVGVLVDWTDFDGRERRVELDTVRAVLSALGHDVAAPGEALAALRNRPSPDMLIVGVDAPITFTGAARAHVTLEDGRRLDAMRDGDELTLNISQPGYHTLELDDRLMTLAVCPPRCVTPRDLLGRDAWGLTAQIYGLRDHGAFGDFASLAVFARAAGQAGADALAISPTNALFPAAPERCSPYSPSSRDHLNILYGDPAALGVAPLPPGGPELIAWSDAARAKAARLNAAYHAFAGDRRFEDFIAAGGAELRRHAIFEALDERLGHIFGAGGWRRWPTEYRDVALAETAVGRLGLGDRVGFFLFAQWLADLGLEQAQAEAKSAGMGIGLIADLAVGLDPGGSHAWRRPNELMLGLTLGAPPDAFQAAGQGWGLTSFAPDALLSANYRPFLETLRAALRHAGGVRIDHALGLGRLWVIPDGASADQGAYLRYPIEDLLPLIALESHRAGAVVIGEDLGVVPPGLRADLDEHGLLGMRVLPFERDEAGAFTPPQGWDRRAVAMTSTHDLPPTAGWWRGRDIDWRAHLGAPGDRDDEREQRSEDRAAFWKMASQAGLADGVTPAPEAPDPVVDAALAVVGQTPCELALIPIEDLLGLEEQPNLPGVVDVHPNWRRRLPTTSQALLSAPDVGRRLARLNAQRPR